MGFCWSPLDVQQTQIRRHFTTLVRIPSGPIGTDWIHMFLDSVRDSVKV